MLHFFSNAKRRFKLYFSQFRQNMTHHSANSLTCLTCFDKCVFVVVVFFYWEFVVELCEVLVDRRLELPSIS